MSPTLLLVEDDRELRETLSDLLRLEGYAVWPSASLADAVQRWNTALPRSRPDLVLLDLGLPDGEGAELLQLVHAATHRVPVIVMSARPGEDVKVQLLDAGADDYLVKPFSRAELLARLRVALRHAGQAMAPARLHYRSADLEIDLTLRRVLRAGRPVHLTPTEFELLARLVRQAGQVVTHRQLLKDVWGAEFTGHTHYLRLYMAQLRSKLEAVPADPQLLLTEPGVGYRLAEAEPRPLMGS